MKKLYVALLGILAFVFAFTCRIQSVYAYCSDMYITQGESESIDTWDLNEYYYWDEYDDYCTAYPNITGYSSSDINIATVDTYGNVYGVAPGTAMITIAYYYNLSTGPLYASESFTVTVNERPNYEYTDYNLEDVAVAKGCTNTITLNPGPNYDYSANSYVNPVFTWEIADTSIAKLADVNGGSVTIKGLKEGTTTLSVKYVYEMQREINTYSATVTLYVTNPKMDKTTIGINTYSGTSGEFVITGVSTASTLTCTSSSKNLSAYGYTDWNDDTKMTGSVSCSKKGEYTVNFCIDGKTFERKVIVFKAYFKRVTGSVDWYMDKKWHQNETMYPMYAGEKKKLTLVSGVKNAKITWSSSDKSVATVAKDGTITGKGDGYATITAYVNGAPLSYEIGVASAPAAKAVREAAKVYGAEYSQEKRMKKGYYDCSSYVWRSYHAIGTNLSGGNGWAPTAADLGKWCNSKGYILMKDYISAEDLLPGDLIFETGENNGRYEGIYHVDFYVGKGISLTVNRNKGWWTGSANVMVARPCPSKFTISASSKSKVNTVKWNVRYGAKAYEVYRSTSKYGTYSKVAVVKGYANNSYKDTSVKKGTTYYYKVRPYWKDGKKYTGKYSDVTSVKTK